METLRWKTRIALLWVLMVVAILAHGLLVTWEPGGLEKMISRMEAMGAGALLFEALFSLIPLWLAFVAITVKDSYNKWVNFVLGIAFTILNIFHFFLCGVPLVEGGPVAEPTAHHILLVGSTVVVTALIAWYAWKWPKQEA
jgi:hypothetical protein